MIRHHRLKVFFSPLLPLSFLLNDVLAIELCLSISLSLLDRLPRKPKTCKMPHEMAKTKKNPCNYEYIEGCLKNHDHKITLT